MPYDPQTNAANPATVGRNAAYGPLVSNIIQNPAMTSPVAGPPVGSNPLPGVGALQEPVTSGEPPPGAFGPLSMAVQNLAQAQIGRGAFGGAPSSTSAPTGNSRSSLGAGAFGGGAGARGR